MVQVGEIIQFEEFNADCNHDTEEEEEVKQETRSRNGLSTLPSKEILIIQEMKANMPQSARDSHKTPQFVASPQTTSITPKVVKKTFDFEGADQDVVKVRKISRGDELNFLSPPHITNNYNFNLHTDVEQKLTQQQL